jgi:hypothetical protein
MLQATSNLAPRGVYVCGSYSSSSGLTVTLQKEAGTGDYAIEVIFYLFIYFVHIFNFLYNFLFNFFLTNIGWSFGFR